MCYQFYIKVLKNQTLSNSLETFQFHQKTENRLQARLEFQSLVSLVCLRVSQLSTSEITQKIQKTRKLKHGIAKCSKLRSFVCKKQKQSYVLSILNLRLSLSPGVNPEVSSLYDSAQIAIHVQVGHFQNLLFTFISIHSIDCRFFYWKICFE